MTKEHLLKYLREPGYLNQVSYQELKTLVAAYPSSLSLRYLLALKSKQENNSDYQRQLTFLGTYSIDRGHLFKVFTQQPEEEILSEGIVLQEDYLELKELSTLERELSTLTKTQSAAMEVHNLPLPSEDLFSNNTSADEYFTLDFDEELDMEVATDPILDETVEDSLTEIEELFKDIEITKSTDEIAIPTNTEASIPSNNGNHPSLQEQEANLPLQEVLNGGEFPDIPLEVLDTEIDVVETEEIRPIENASFAIDKEELIINPIPKTNFSTWFEERQEDNYFNGFDLIGYNSKGLIEELIQKDQNNLQEQAAENPMDMEEGIASETLAQLLVVQGHYMKAKMMYEQLKLIYPEKNSFFAAEIQRIENLETESTL